MVKSKTIHENKTRKYVKKGYTLSNRFTIQNKPGLYRKAYKKTKR